jgi:septal ring factor EnvC (AmiA/AmiB activator)
LRYVVAACCLFLAVGTQAAPSADDAKRNLAEIAKKLNDLDSWLLGAKSRQRDLQKAIKSGDEKIANATSAVRKTQEALAASRERLAELADERKALEANRRSQAEKIAEHLTSAYRLSGQDFFKLLLNQQNPDDLDRMIRYHRYFTEARTETLKAYQETLVELETNATQMQKREKELADQERTLAASLAALKTNRSERERLLASLQKEMSGKSEQRERLSADRKRLEQLIAELSKPVDKPVVGAFGQNRGKLPWPLAGKVANGFGSPRAGGKLKWQGIFIAAPEGTPVKAIHRGRVAFADWLRGFGLVTIVDHGGGYMSLYAHADALYRKPGDWVDAGDALASAGKSGGETRSGLYFEIRSKGEPSNPIQWLVRR